MRVRRGFQLGAAAAVLALAAAGGTDLALIAAHSGHREAATRASRPTPSRTPAALPAAAGAAAAVALPHPRAPLHLPGPRPSRPAGTLPPDSVAIPRQGVVAPVGVCTMDAGALEPPADVARTCRWAGGAALGDSTGTVALTGHINWVGQGTGALGRLAQLRPGDSVLTADERGRVTRWHVTSVELRSKSRGVDLAAFAGSGGPRVLYLVSCGGPFDAADASYLDNVYVRAVPTR